MSEPEVHVIVRTTLPGSEYENIRLVRTRKGWRGYGDDSGDEILGIGASSSAHKITDDNVGGYVEDMICCRSVENDSVCAGPKAAAVDEVPSSSRGGILAEPADDTMCQVTANRHYRPGIDEERSPWPEYTWAEVKRRQLTGLMWHSGCDEDALVLIAGRIVGIGGAASPGIEVDPAAYKPGQMETVANVGDAIDFYADLAGITMFAGVPTDMPCGECQVAPESECGECEGRRRVPTDAGLALARFFARTID